MIKGGFIPPFFINILQGLDTIMLIDLHNFFRYYDEKNPKHVAAVEQLEKDLNLKAQELMQDDANWVRIFRTKEDKPQATILPVPFYPHRSRAASLLLHQRKLGP